MKKMQSWEATAEACGYDKMLTEAEKMLEVAEDEATYTQELVYHMEQMDEAKEETCDKVYCAHDEAMASLKKAGERVEYIKKARDLFKALEDCLLVLEELNGER